MSITLFSVTLAGAIGAINAIDNLTTSYVSEGEQREANDADGGKSIKLVTNRSCVA